MADIIGPIANVFLVSRGTYVPNFMSLGHSMRGVRVPSLHFQLFVIAPACVQFASHERVWPMVLYHHAKFTGIRFVLTKLTEPV